MHFVRFVSHNLADGNEAVQLRDRLEAVVGEVPEWRQLYEGLQEAMTNVVHHAYPENLISTRRVLHNQWWMSGSYDERDGQLTVMFFDQGVGIPATLPRNYKRSQIRAFLSKAGLVDEDASRIQAAMDLGATQTKAGHRGHGLMEMRQYIDAMRGGRMRILSGKGEYIYTYNDSEEVRRTHPLSIGGTLVQWEITKSPQ